MNDDYKRGLVTGMAVQPLYVTTGAGYKFGAHNLLADCTFNSTFGVQIDGEKVIVNVPANLAVAWYNFTSSGITFKYDYMYKLVAKFNGYGRIGLSTTLNAPFTEEGTHTCGTRDDNFLVGVNVDNALFYVNKRTTGVSTLTGNLWFCSDATYDGVRAAHSFEIALYEEDQS